MSSPTNSQLPPTRPSSTPMPAPPDGKLDLRADLEPVAGFRLVEVLGRGGFGEVWKAIGPGGVPVAMKFVPLQADGSSRELRSLEFMKDIRHAHLIAIFGVWQCHGHVVIAMELADRTLLDRCREAVKQGLPGIPLVELLEYFREAAKGLDYLNSLGVQHRDVKPHNLFLVGGCVKVADFGLAKIVHEAGAEHTGAMTPAFAPPEFFNGQTSDHSDQYALAVTYCKLRAGRLPFAGESAVEVMNNVLDRTPDLTMLPESERPIVARALAKHPKDRWPDCRSFVQALTAAARPSAQLPAPPPTLPAPVPSAVRRHRQQRAISRRAMLISGLGLLFVIAIVGYKEWTAPIPLQEVRCFRDFQGPVSCVVFAPGGKDLLAAGEDRTVRGLPVVGDASQYVLSRQPAPVRSIALSPAGNQAVAGCDKGIVRMWETKSDKQLWLAAHDKGAVYVAVSPDGKMVLSGGTDGKLKLWDAANGKQSLETNAHGMIYKGSLNVAAVAFVPDGRRWVASRSNTIGVWWLGTPQSPTFYHPAGFLGDPITQVVVAPDGQHVLFGQGSDIRDCNLDKGTENRHLRGHSGQVNAVAFAPDGRHALSGSEDRTVRYWDLESGKEIGRFTGHTGAVLSVAISPDGKLAASGAADGTVRLIKLAE